MIPDFSKGLVPAVVQDAKTSVVLMLAYMNEEAYRETLATGRACYYSRSRDRLWYKGEESGHVQIVKSVTIDCDADTVLLKVEQIGGAACHEGYVSCFYREVTAEGMNIIAERIVDPKTLYKNRLLPTRASKKDSAMADCHSQNINERRIAPRLQPAHGTQCRFDEADGQSGPVVGLVWNISPGLSSPEALGWSH